MKNDFSQESPKYSNFSKHPKPAYLVKYEEYLENILSDDIRRRADDFRKEIIRMLLSISRDAYLEGWMDGGGESPYVTGNGVRLDPRVPGGIIPPAEKTPPKEE